MDNLNEDNKNKPKAGLGGVRPDAYTMEKFKSGAKDNNMSQTKFFESIFWSYLSKDKENKKEDALSLEGEISLLSQDLNSMFEHIKTIAEKAQNTIISIKSNAEQNEKNLSLDLDTANKKVAELQKRNEELEISNSTFSEVKANLEAKTLNLSEENKQQAKAIDEYKKDVISKEKRIKELEETLKKTENLYEKESKTIKLQKDQLQDELISKNNEINNLKTSISSLKDTVNNIELMKKSELEATESKYKLKIAELELKLDLYNEDKAKEIESIKRTLLSELTAEKKEEVADMKLQLANMTAKYADIITELNNYKNKQ
jgi:chromosome segregation ATPase